MLAVLAGCGSPPRAEAGELVAARIRTRIEAAGAAADLRAGGEPVYASLVLPKFYERRLYRPAWTDARGPTRLADDLVTALRRSDLEGLRSEDYHLAGIEAVLAAARADAKHGPALGPDRWAELDLLLTDAFLVYGAHLVGGRVNPETLSPEWVSNRRTADVAVVLEAALASGDIPGAIEGLVPPQYGYRRLREALAKDREVAAAGGWPAIPDGVTLQRGDSGGPVVALRQRLRLEDDLQEEPAEGPHTDLFDEPVEQAVKVFQQRHGLAADGVVNAATRAELNVPVERRVEQLELNLERWRWLPKDLGRRHVIVNIAAYELEVVDADSVVLAMRVVVGRPYDRTPVLSDTMRYLVLNPYWHVPRDLAVDELVPKVRRNPSYLAHNGLRVFPAGNDAREVDPATINWAAITPNHFPYQLRQDPGPRNALGRIKFMFLNKYHVYLHDTPAGSLFAEAQRDFSHGCIRIQHPIDLAVYLLQDPLWDRDAILLALDDAVDRTVPLPQPIPIHLLYWTAWAAADGTIQFRRDIHGRDAPLLTALRAPPPSTN
jgi:L,D-transpeptidase YcbB